MAQSWLTATSASQVQANSLASASQSAGITGFSHLTQLDIRNLSDAYFVNIFSQSVGGLFTFLIIYFAVQKLFSLIWSHLSIFGFLATAFENLVINYFLRPMSRTVFPRFSSVIPFFFLSLGIHVDMVWLVPTQISS